MIETHDLTKRYGDIVAVDELTLSARRGEVTDSCAQSVTHRFAVYERGWENRTLVLAAISAPRSVLPMRMGVLVPSHLGFHS